ncbi:hypothetical protein LB503_009872 [Fusarium chuoi]|nr:hypothetical protein LB503_009872 [Fusarium chuoi]
MSLPKLDKATLGHVVQLAKNRNILAGAAAVLLIGLIPRFNAWLTRRKVNNYLTDSSWDWTKEVVVVTGGSSGIGKEIPPTCLSAQQTFPTLLRSPKSPSRLSLNMVTQPFSLTTLELETPCLFSIVPSPRSSKSST